MIMSVNPQTREILLTSIPRDMYLPLHTYGAEDKLTHSGIYGIQETTSTVEDWLGIDINYYLRVNFTTLTDVVDAIGGVDVESAYSFSSSVSDYSYVAGNNHLSGEAALYFARERKSLPGGDNERIKNQQRVLTAIIDKMTSSTVLLTKYTQLLGAVGDKMQTSLSENDISAIVKMQLKDMRGWNIESNSIKGKGAMLETYSMPGRKLSCVMPDEESVTEAQKKINYVFYPPEI
jgi:LCP family protein required for cell wall assembly